VPLFLLFVVGILASRPPNEKSANKKGPKIGDGGENATYQTYLGQVLKHKKCGRMICFFIVKEFVDGETTLLTEV
jgi:hypothetical protein